MEDLMRGKSRAVEILEKEYVSKLKTKSDCFIGVEFEYLLISRDTVSFREIGNEFMEYLIESCNFSDPVLSSEGYIECVSKGDDTISFDTVYSTLEFSVGCRKTLDEIHEVWENYYRISKEFYDKKNIIISGIGENRLHEMEFTEVKDDVIRMYTESLTKAAGKNVVMEHMTRMSSVQTHLDIPYDSFLRAYNLFNEMSFVDGLLFANSPSMYEDVKYYCLRDIEWEGLSVDTGVFDRKFESMGELLEAISKEKLLICEKNGELEVITPVSIDEYFTDGNNPESDFRFFRSFRNIIFNKYGVLEFREDCTQPIGDCLATTAFHLGIARNIDKAEKIISDFKEELNLTRSNSELRHMVISGESIGDEDIQRKYLRDFVDCAREGLLLRGYNEEKYIAGLYHRAESLECPGKTFWRLLSEGKDIFDIENSFGSGSF